MTVGLQACGREQECIDLYKVLEQQHPSAKIKRQAEQLRFIMEAPRLKLRPDERVSVPVLEAGGRFVCATSPSCIAPQVPAQSLSAATCHSAYLKLHVSACACSWRPVRAPLGELRCPAWPLASFDIANCECACLQKL